MSTNRLKAEELDRAIAETQESHIASLRRQWFEQMPEPEPEPPAYHGVFFDDPLADWVTIFVLGLASAALVALIPGPGGL